MKFFSNKQFYHFNSFIKRWMIYALKFLASVLQMYLIFLYFTTLYQIFPLYRIIRYSISEFSHNEGLIGPDAYFVISRADCNTSLKDIILDKCTLRWEKMYHPAIVIAYYLDPR